MREGDIAVAYLMPGLQVAAIDENVRIIAHDANDFRPARAEPAGDAGSIQRKDAERDAVAFEDVPQFWKQLSGRDLDLDVFGQRHNRGGLLGGEDQPAIALRGDPER